MDEGIINLCSYSSKSYISVIISDSEVTFIGEEEDTIFRPFFYYVLLHIDTFKDKPLKLEDHFTYLVFNISSTESYVNIRIGEICTAPDKLSTI